MFRSVRPYVDQAEIREPVVCYQGAAVVDPSTGRFLVHLPVELELARELVAFLVDRNASPNVYVDDELYVAEHNDHSRAYAGFQHLPVHEVGNLLGWLDEPPTKLVVVADPSVLEPLRAEATERFGDELFVTTSLPTFLEFGRAGVSKGTALASVCKRLGLDLSRVVAFGDGENDVELIQTAGFGVAIETGHERLLAVADATCPPPAAFGVARIIEAVLAAPLQSPA
jgi:Cof subfamily protein (haloacid dehalogenase superfamily)